MTALTVPILLGTAREGRQSEKVAQYVLAQAKAYGFDSTLVDIRDHVTPMTVRKKDDPTAGVAWENIVKAADALIIVSPEYNHGYPGELKILLDKLYKQYTDLPVAICSVSDGRYGGARLIEHFQPILANFKMRFAGSVAFATVPDLFDAAGNLTDESTAKRVPKLFAEVQRLAELFQHGKQA
ncbi:MAG: NAD(P)H-dependent oxidoreductase [Candidatus Kerfeldbacteria bacterium]|nr:NAD(P)H-dependent oxidoreductase [Candidatus Kerfeldbacteria bacterium]